MATLTHAIKTAEKLAQQTVQINDVREHWVTYKGYTVSFFPNGRMSDDVQATGFYTSNKARTEDDHNSDYFPGTFHDNILQAFRFVDRRTAN